MKKIVHIILSVAMLFALISCANQAPQTKYGKKLVWSEEFNYSGLPDPMKWKYDIGGDGYGNNEKQFYTEKRLKMQELKTEI